ncbi:hypothetical protein S83_042259 [Arachis hypogaea]
MVTAEHNRGQRRRSSLVTPLSGSSASFPRRQCLLASSFSVCVVLAALALPCLACLCLHPRASSASASSVIILHCSVGP